MDTSLGQHGIILNLRFPGETNEKQSTHTQLLKEANILSFKFKSHESRASEVVITDHYQREWAISFWGGFDLFDQSININAHPDGCYEYRNMENS